MDGSRPLFARLSSIVALPAEVARSYAAVLFCESPFAGLLFLAATLWKPAIGLSGLLAALCGRWAARLLGYSVGSPEPIVYNSLLVGLWIGASTIPDAGLIVLIAAGAALTTIVTPAIASLLWRAGELPVLSLPFVLVSWALGLAAQASGNLVPGPLPSHTGAVFPLGLDGFFEALGWFLFAPHPIAGFLLFVGLLATSRYLAILALCGYGVGTATLVFLGDPAASPTLTGFNFMLTAMALGGIFSVPGRAGFLVAMFGAALAALASAGLKQVLTPHHLPALASPFLLAAYTMLAGLRQRLGISPPVLTLANPALPEISYERARLAKTRLGDPESVPLFPPFLGEWHVYQGFHGRHTHQPPWQHALDFFILDQGRSFRTDGGTLDDYNCYGASVTAPASGTVVRRQDDLPDNAPGEVDTTHNWGNHVLLRIATGHTVLLAHLRPGSIVVREGEWVSAGQPLAACGNSGRSPQPHLHLQVQREPALGSPTSPFHLCNILARAEAGPEAGPDPVFQLAGRPVEGTSVAASGRDERLAASLHLPAGRTLGYRFRESSSRPPAGRRLSVEVTLLGQFRIVSDIGGSAAFEEKPNILAFFDRRGNRDRFLDLWLLAMGLTPLTGGAVQWHDSPPARLMPLAAWQRLLVAFSRPLGAWVESRYRRTWDDAAQVWRQEGVHTLRLGLGAVLRVSTSAAISPIGGCESLVVEAGSKRWTAFIESEGRVDDNGVPRCAQERNLSAVSQMEER
ncbi:MAG: urea transporter [Nitrospirae bacterium]|nr:urea transporter [Nitrospirota bacterium]